MADEITKVETSGFGSRLKGSLGGALFGILLVLSSFGLLWWNESRTVGTAGALKSASKKIVSLPTPTLNPAHEGKLVHVSGLANTKQTAKDDSFGIAPDALRISRTVEMYQWIEKSETTEKEKTGGSKERVTTYTYEKSWEKSRVDHSKFKDSTGHTNPDAPFAKAVFMANRVKVGDFFLGEAFHRDMGPEQSVVLGETNLLTIPAALKASGARIIEGRLVTGEVTNAKVGDLRISWTWVPNNLPVSVAAMQSGANLEPFFIDKKEVSRIAMGTVSARSMLAKAQDDNSRMAWILRVLGFFMMWAGLRLALGPVAMLLAFIPFLKKLAEIGIAVITFLIAAAFSLLTIAIAWLFYRPALSISLLALAGGAIYLVILYRRRKKQEIAQKS